MHGDIRFKIAAARRILFRAGLDRDDIAGQVTAREAGDDALWTTPLELFDETMPDHVVKMPFGTKATGNRVIEIDGEPRPVTTASRWVEAIYRARPDVRCVIHTHAAHIAAVASTGETVQLYNNRSLVFAIGRSLRRTSCPCPCPYQAAGCCTTLADVYRRRGGEIP